MSCHEICCQDRAERIRRRVRIFLLFGFAVATVQLAAPALIPDTDTVVVVDRSHAIDAADHNWKVSEASWYGPGFYGNRTACGQRYTREIQGVAHKTLPCGTLVRFEWHGRELVVPVIDRGPYTRGREWDLSHGACQYLGRCFTAGIAWTR